MLEFSMPRSGTWEERGGWVAAALCAELFLRVENASGLVGNLGGETYGFRDLHERRPTVPGSKGGRGWAQWTGTSPRNNRRLLFEQFCAGHKLDPESDEGNYRYLVHELRTTERGALERVRLAVGLWAATRAAHVYYERSSDLSEEETRRRYRWAERAMTGALAHQASGLAFL